MVNGTGFLVGSNLLLTANHCVFQSNGQPKSNLAFKPAYDYGTYNNMSCGWQNLMYTANYFSTDDPGDDWCLVELDYSYGSTVGWLVCANYNPISSLVNVVVRSIGYPGADGYDGQHQYYNIGQVSSYNTNSFITPIYVVPGMSGGPTARFSDDYVVGINSRKITHNDGTIELESCKISQTIINTILANQ